MRFIFCFVIIAALCNAFPAAIALAQDEQAEPAVVAEPSEQEEQVEGDVQDEEEIQSGGTSIPTFTLLPTQKNTYVVTRNLRGLKCVVGVGDKNSCAVIRGPSVGKDYPWDTLKCRSGDSSVGTYASYLDNKRQVYIFAAPPALMTSANTNTINVQLGRVCLRK